MDFFRNMIAFQANIAPHPQWYIRHVLSFNGHLEVFCVFTSPTSAPTTTELYTNSIVQNSPSRVRNWFYYNSKTQTRDAIVSGPFQPRWDYLSTIKDVLHKRKQKPGTVQCNGWPKTRDRAIGGLNQCLCLMFTRKRKLSSHIVTHLA